LLRIVLAIAAAVYHFLELSPDEQAASLARLQEFVGHAQPRTRAERGEILKVRIPDGGRVIG
jgi:hypothetical protein